MTKNVLDNARVLAAIAGDDGEDDRQGPGVPMYGKAPQYHVDLALEAPSGIAGRRVAMIRESFK
jgi:Asp-tRNA(Asn)/Glu-tRNA(Gln) amidotransferase A subunit family amidase